LYNILRKASLEGNHLWHAPAPTTPLYDTANVGGNSACLPGHLACLPHAALWRRIRETSATYEVGLASHELGGHSSVSRSNGGLKNDSDAPQPRQHTNTERYPVVIHIPSRDFQPVFTILGAALGLLRLTVPLL
jgi:hypothetical protein